MNGNAMIREILARFLLLAALLTAAPALADTLPAGAATVRIVVPARDIARGETIADSDLTYATIAGGALMGGTVTNPGSLKGMEARRVLHAGEALRLDDVRHPVLVSKGQTVTMLFEVPGVSLTAMGRAMSEGGAGDTVTIQNPASFRMISATVISAGTVRANGPAAAVNPQLTARK